MRKDFRGMGKEKWEMRDEEEHTNAEAALVIRLSTISGSNYPPIEVIIISHFSFLI